jgi:hypothetical protein
MVEMGEADSRTEEEADKAIWPEDAGDALHVPYEN